MFSQAYNAEGWGAGYRPNINNYVDNSAGNILLKDRYVNDTDGHFPEYGMTSIQQVMHLVSLITVECPMVLEI
ncbi:hypothetical protein AFI02nite_40180 [Aliivibrio fischeri]|uniref:Uncharacterized protein n=1 Tax=Aliivibrio fischeri TaxID=668 RepID=A0A510UMS6_ALIFS|nr:hypothetical protein AFI02nite_40180 [Aliivibrio fischeri]